MRPFCRELRNTALAPSPPVNAHRAHNTASEKEHGAGDAHRAQQPRRARVRSALRIYQRAVPSRLSAELQPRPVHRRRCRALLRWQHPTRGLVQPDEFVPILEQTGQIQEVDRWVLTNAREQMAAWHARGDTLDISVNVSGSQLKSNAIIEHIHDALTNSGLGPASLIIEVTETALMHNADATALLSVT